MFNLSGSEVVFILLLALVVLGPERLPVVIRRFGRIYGELRKMGTGFQAELRQAIDEPMREMRETADLTRRAVDDSLRAARDTGPDAAGPDAAGPDDTGSDAAGPDDERDGDTPSGSAREDEGRPE